MARQFCNYCLFKYCQSINNCSKLCYCVFDVYYCLAAVLLQVFIIRVRHFEWPIWSTSKSINKIDDFSFPENPIQTIIFFNYFNQVSGEGGGSKLYNGSIHCAQTIYKAEGVRGFYNGLSASFARQLTYTTARLGIYNILLEHFTVEGKTHSFETNALPSSIKVDDPTN